MTPAEHRAKCIEAIWRRACELGIFISYGQAAIIFDSLNGIARVTPIEATEEMIEATNVPGWADEDPNEMRAIWRAMSARGDLTKPPAGKKI